MKQESLCFDGVTFDATRDAERLSSQLRRVYSALQGGSWWTLAQLSVAAGGSEASVSARIRDLRKPRFGRHLIEREYVADGVWRYRMKEHP